MSGWLLHRQPLPISNLCKGYIMSRNELNEVFEPELTTNDRLLAIAVDNGIDITDWYGKYLVLQLILNSMDKKEADNFLNDTFSMLEDEIKNAYEAL